jgi:hypothetical protein
VLFPSTCGLRLPYVNMQQMIDAATPFGLRSYWKGGFLRDLPDGAVDTFADFAECCTSPRTFAILEHAHGATSRVAPDATAFPAMVDLSAQSTRWRFQGPDVVGTLPAPL